VQQNKRLGKGHGQELVHAGEILNLVIAAVSGHASTESDSIMESVANKVGDDVRSFWISPHDVS
jgi:hypothetical protein